jgi:hypothetical protein
MDKDCCTCGEKTERIVVLLLLYVLTIESNKNGHCPVGVTAAIRNPAQRDPVVGVLPTNNNSSRRNTKTVATQHVVVLLGRQQQSETQHNRILVSIANNSSRNSSSRNSSSRNTTIKNTYRPVCLL